MPTMTTRTKQPDPRSLRVDRFFAAIEAHDTAVGMCLLWALPVLAVVIGLFRL